MKLSAKRKTEIFEKILTEYRKGQQAVTTLARAEGIPPSTFRSWLNSTPKFNKAYEDAHEEILELRRAENATLARMGLKQRIVGEMVKLKEVHFDADGNPTGHRVRDAYYPASDRLISETLRASDPSFTPLTGIETDENGMPNVYARHAPPIHFILPDGTEIENPKPHDYTEYDRP